MLINSCKSGHDYPKSLPGTWKAYGFIQDGKAADFDLSRLQFTFDSGGRYTFTSSDIKTQEAGIYPQMLE